MSPSRSASPPRKSPLAAEYDAIRAQYAGIAAAHLARVQRQARLQRNAAALGGAAIPPRFAGYRVASFIARSHAQSRVSRAAQRYAIEFKDMRRRGTNLLLLGRPRTGKTHLACGILNEIIDAGYTGRFTTVAQVMAAFRDVYRDDAPCGEGEILARYTDIDLLALDEAGVASGSASYRQDRLFEVINERVNHRRPTLILGNLDQDQLCAWLGERSFKRLVENGAPLLPFEWPPYIGDYDSESAL